MSTPALGDIKAASPDMITGGRGVGDILGGPPTSVLPCFAAGHRVVVGAVAHEAVMYRSIEGVWRGEVGDVNAERRKGVGRQALQAVRSGETSEKPSHGAQRKAGFCSSSAAEQRIRAVGLACRLAKMSSTEATPDGTLVVAYTKTQTAVTVTSVIKNINAGAAFSPTCSFFFETAKYPQLDLSLKRKNSH